MKNTKPKRTFWKSPYLFCVYSIGMFMNRPELPDDEPDEIMQMSMNIDISNPFKDLEDSGGDSNLWENAEEREFYDGLTDLRAHVPAMYGICFGFPFF